MAWLCLIQGDAPSMVGWARRAEQGVSDP